MATDIAEDDILTSMHTRWTHLYEAASLFVLPASARLMLDTPALSKPSKHHKVASPRHICRSLLIIGRSYCQTHNIDNKDRAGVLEPMLVIWTKITLSSQIDGVVAANDQASLLSQLYYLRVSTSECPITLEKDKSKQAFILYYNLQMLCVKFHH